MGSMCSSKEDVNLISEKDGDKKYAYLMNPPLTNANNEPIRFKDNEYFILYKDGIDAQIRLSDKMTIACKGRLVLTTLRICIINKEVNMKEVNKAWKAIDLPLSHMLKESF